MAISTIPEAIEDIKNGRMVILVDDEDRENEGDLCMAAEFVTPEAVNFMARHGRGLICLTLSEELARKINLPLMVNDNQSRFKTAFTVYLTVRNMDHSAKAIRLLYSMKLEFLHLTVI